MLKVQITIGANGLSVEGDAVTFADSLPLIAQWFTAIEAAELDREKLRELTARLTSSTDALVAAESADTAGNSAN